MNNYYNYLYLYFVNVIVLPIVFDFALGIWRKLAVFVLSPLPPVVGCSVLSPPSVACEAESSQLFFGSPGHDRFSPRIPWY